MKTSEIDITPMLNAYPDSVGKNLEGMLNFFKDVHPSKADAPMDVTFFPMDTDFSFLQFLNAFARISVTL